MSEKSSKFLIADNPPEAGFGECFGHFAGVEHTSLGECYTRSTGMNAFRQRRLWFWIAFAAIAIAVIALLVPHGVNTAHQPTWLALLPVLFIGLMVPLNLRPLSVDLCIRHAPDAPTLAPSFQRPPPAELA